MSNYRRLISYIYAYEGDVKGKNIGFAKIEARNGQCKISVNVKKVYVGSNDMGVYLLSSGGEILLGTIFIRNGAGEYRTVVPVNNVESSGYTMDQCYGLTIHDLKDSWQAYKTIWEDAVTHAAEVALKDAESKTKEVTDYKPIIKEIEKEVKAQVELNEQEKKVQNKEEIVTEAVEEESADQQPLMREFLNQDSIQEKNDQPEISLNQPISEDQVIGSGFERRIDLSEFREMTDSTQEITTPNLESPVQPVFENEMKSEKPPIVDESLVKPEPIGNMDELERLQREEEEISRTQNTWHSFRKMYPKIQAFDYEKGCEIITIKPQDIGMLPRETWVYGNNSFLLHGFYNYRYLILAKLENPEGLPRYLLGVPGHYYSNEKYMASMFGFPNFVLSKQQPAGDGRFGYWYTDIKLGN